MRIDLFDKFAGVLNKANRTRETRRQETISTIKSTEPQQRARARVFSSVNILVPDTSFTTLAFDQVDFDNIGLHTSSTKFTIPSTGRVTGLWLVHGRIFWVGTLATGTFRVLNLMKNTSTVLASDAKSCVSPDQCTNDVLRYINDPQPGDSYELQALQASGGNLNIIHEDWETYFEIIQIW